MLLADAVRELPRLLFLLLKRVSAGAQGSRKMTSTIIDADAIDLLTEIRDTLHVWSLQVRSPFYEDDLVRSFDEWARAFASAVVPDEKMAEHARVCEGWITRMREKYFHPQIREWLSPCPTCGAHVVESQRDGETVKSYAVELNVDDRLAICRECGDRFDIPLLRLLTNVAEQIARGLPVDDAALEIYKRFHSNNVVLGVENVGGLV